MTDLSSMTDPLVPLAKDWLPKLVKEWTRIRATRKAELDRIFLELGDYEQLARTYIEPDGQSGNPADFDEDESIPIWETGARRVPMREWVNEFLKGETKVRDGRNTLFVLSDAGMGKSSLLIMLKITHLLRFWPDRLDFRLLKLGESTLAEIREIGAGDCRRSRCAAATRS